MDEAQRAELIAKYRAGHAAIVEAVAQAGANLDRQPPDGSWTARQVVHHLADSEMTSALRLRRLLAEDDVAIVGYPEDAWAKRLRYTERPIEGSLEAMRWARATTADILDCMTEADWERAGTHNELGRYTPETWLDIYARHAFEHAAQIVRAAGTP